MAICTVCNAEVADDQVDAHMSEMHPSDGSDMGGGDASSSNEGMSGGDASSEGGDSM